VLDLACGECKEGYVLSAFFGGNQYGLPSDKVKIVGIDVDKSEIDRAIRRQQKPDYSQKITTWHQPSNFEFICGDVTRLNQYPEIPQQVDVVIIRHQQISDNEQKWLQIFRQGLERITQGGFILITSYSDIEHQMLIEVLQKLPCQIVLNEKNPWARPLSHKEISLDRNVVIAKRQ